MKKVLLICACFFGWIAFAHAQQVPLYSQYFHNPFIYNPAWAGLEKFASANLTFRRQWEGLEGAPQTILATLDLPFYENRAGFGINVFQDRIGLFQQNKVQFSYAYHLFELYENSSVFSFGLTGGLITNRIDFNNAFILNPNDPQILNNTGNYQGLEFTFGMNYIFQDKFQIGFTMPQFLTTGIRTIDNSTNDIQLQPHFLLAARCTLKTYDEIHRIEPMLMLRKVGNVPLQFDIGAQYIWNNTLWFNAAFRTSYSAVAAVGFNVKSFRIGLARDFAVSELQGAVGSTNEIMMGYKFNHLKTKTYGAQKGRANTNLRRKVEHPSRPGPVYRPNNLHLKKNSKKKPNVNLRSRRRSN